LCLVSLASGGFSSVPIRRSPPEVNEQVLDRILPMLVWRCASLARGLAPEQNIDLLRHGKAVACAEPTLLAGYLSGKVIGSLVD
jgi:hypothetical protein